MTTDKRFIEESFPVKEVSIESAREKSHSAISILHPWWSRKPLAVSRTIVYATLIPWTNNSDEWEKQRNFIIEFSKWDNSNNPAFVNKARADILKANGGIPPKLLDPFGGGGSIPLEALHLGCETYSIDYNPVAVIIEKCTLEYPQKFGHQLKKNETWGELKSFDNNPLISDVNKWGQWVLNEVKTKIEKFYPPDPDGSIPIGYYWMRFIPCQNPSCQVNIPLASNLWLVKKDKKKIALYPNCKNGQVRFKIVGDGYDEIPEGFDPELGTVSRAIVTCPCCGSTIDADTTRKLFQEGKSGNRMIVVILSKSGTIGKKYRLAVESDVKLFKQAESELAELIPELQQEWGIAPIPDEPIKRVPVSFGVINVWVYGMLKWGDLFNPRQKLALVTFIKSIRNVYQKMKDEGNENDYSIGVVTYLASALDREAEDSSTLCRWNPSSEKMQGTFGRQSLPMTWDYCEINPFGGSVGDWNSLINLQTEAIDYFSNTASSASHIYCTSATTLPFPDMSFDSIITDPPYYDNVPYSYLSDFFYVWLKRSIGDLYPDLFTTSLTPKKQEVVAYSNGPGGYEEGKKYFEDMLGKSFHEIHRVLKPNGIAVIVYAHKSTEGWETLINSLLDSGLIITGAWPISTEMGTRLRSQASATLTSSIYIVARKMERQPTGFYNNVKEELKTHLNKKLDRLWHEGISGADFFIAAIGSAIEVFGKYEQVMDYEGNVVRADRLLLDVRKIATDYAVRQILHNGFAGEISDMARLYVLWRWNYSEAKVPFDEARKLGQSCGIDISHEWSHTGFIKKEKEFIRLLGPQERKLEDLEGSKDMIDVLHQVLLLWEKSKRDEMIKVLQLTGFGKSEAFYRVAQAISESLPNESKEKKLLEGFTAGRDRMTEEVKKEARQARLEF